MIKKELKQVIKDWLKLKKSLIGGVKHSQSKKRLKKKIYIFILRSEIWVLFYNFKYNIWLNLAFLRRGWLKFAAIVMAKNSPQKMAAD